MGLPLLRVQILEVISADSVANSCSYSIRSVDMMR